MNIKKLFVLIAAILAPCLAMLAQSTAPAPAPTAPAPSAETPSGSPSALGPGDALDNPPQAPVIAHGTAAEPPAAESAPLTNESSNDEVLETVVFDGIPLPDAVNALALQAGLNIQFDPKLLNTVGPDGHAIPVTPPTISAKWKHLTARQALAALLDNWGWQLVMDPHSPIGRITAKDPTAPIPLVTTVIELQYSNPTNILAEVAPTLSIHSSIISDMRTHKLIVRTTERELPGVEALIAKLDTATRQVLIEAKLVQTTKASTSAKGIDWTKTLAAQNVSFGNGLSSAGVTNLLTTVTSPLTTTSTTSPGGSPISGTSGGGLVSTANNVTSFQNVVSGVPSEGAGLSLNTAHGFSPTTAFLNADGLQAVLSFLNTDADTKTINFPRTVALDGVQTEIMVVQNIPIFEQQQSAPAAGASQGLATVLPNYDKKVEGTVLNEVGTKLTVIPRIAGPTNVLLDVRPELSSVDPQVASDTLDGQVSTSPIFDRSRITTQASVPSGYTLVLGGLETDNDTKTYTKVPLLGDTPGLSYLFSSSSKGRTRTTILIFVTPTIISDSDYQPSTTQFLKRKGMSISDEPPRFWDNGKPWDWTKPDTSVSPSYQP